MRYGRRLSSAIRPHHPRTVPILLFTHHKGGTVLLAKVFREISHECGWRFKSHMGRRTELFEGVDTMLFGNALLDPTQLDVPHVGVHFVRDPRDVIVSGFLYHQRTAEEWCVNREFGTEPPIVFPQVPYSVEHRPEAWKADYLASLQGRSYQENLLSMSQTDGLLFEIEHYGAWTVDGMRAWSYDTESILEVKFEQVMENYDASFREIFEHLGFSGALLDSALSIAARHDLGRKSDREIEKMAHVSAKKTSKWREYFEEVHKQAFLERFGDVLVKLGYETGDEW